MRSRSAGSPKRHRVAQRLAVERPLDGLQRGAGRGRAGLAHLHVDDLVPLALRCAAAASITSMTMNGGTALRRESCRASGRPVFVQASLRGRHGSHSGCRKPSNGHGCALTARACRQSRVGPIAAMSVGAPSGTRLIVGAVRSCLGPGHVAGPAQPIAPIGALNTRFAPCKPSEDRDRGNNAPPCPAATGSAALGPRAGVGWRTASIAAIYAVSASIAAISPAAAQNLPLIRDTRDREPSQGLFDPDLQGRRPRLAEHLHAHRAARKLQRLRGGRPQRVHQHGHAHAGQDAQRGASA